MRHNYIFAHNINRKQSPELIFYLHNLQPVEYTSYTPSVSLFLTKIGLIKNASDV